MDDYYAEPSHCTRLKFVILSFCDGIGGSIQCSAEWCFVEKNIPSFVNVRVSSTRLSKSCL